MTLLIIEYIGNVFISTYNIHFGALNFVSRILNVEITDSDPCPNRKIFISISVHNIQILLNLDFFCKQG